MPIVVIKKCIKIILEQSEDFIDLYENSWIFMWTLVGYTYIHLMALFLTITIEYQKAIQNQYLYYVTTFIRNCLPSQLLLSQQNYDLYSFVSIVVLIITLLPFIKVVYAYIMKSQNVVSSFMVRYFTMFNWVLFIPITDLYSELAVGQLSSGNSTELYSFNMIIGYIGLPFLILTSLIITFLYRNHQFRDTNLTRKKQSGLSYVQIVLIYILLIINASGGNQVFRVVLFHLSMLLQLIEYFQAFPIPDPELSRFYLKLMCITETCCILLTLLFFTSFNDEELYCLWLLENIVFFWVLSDKIFEIYFDSQIILINDRVEGRFLSFDKQQLRKEEVLIRQYLSKRRVKDFDIYVEYIQQLQQRSVRSQRDKMKLINIIINHRKNCINLQCYCHNREFHLFKHELLQKKVDKPLNLDKLDKEYTRQEEQRQKQKKKILDNMDDQSIDTQNVNKFISILFRETIKLQRRNFSQRQLELTILKYVSFIVKILDNPPQAFYDLKTLVAECKNQSFYFQLVEDVIAKAVQNQIIKKQLIYIATQAVEEGNVNVQNDPGMQQSITLENMLEQINYQEQISGEVKGVIQLKVHFWNNYLSGDIIKFQDVQDKLVQAIHKLNNIMVVYEKVLQNTNSQSIISARVKQIYHMIVTRDIKEIKQLEHQFLEMIRKDKSMPVECLTSLRVLENEVEILITSILKDKGRILNKKTPRMAAFFNYDFESFKAIYNVKQLMPIFLSQVHNQLMDNFLRRGYSRIIKASDRDVFMMDAEGFIKPVKLNLENFFGFKDDFNLIAALMHLKQNKQYIIFDITGKIQGASKQLYQSIQEKSEYINEKYRKENSQQSQSQSQSKSLTRDQFFKELYIFMLIPDLIRKLKDFLAEQRHHMEELGYEKIDEENIMKYFISTNQKNIEICRYHKCELFVPQNLQMIIDGFNDIQKEELGKNLIKQKSSQGSSFGLRTLISENKTLNNQDESELDKINRLQDLRQFIQGLSIFDPIALNKMDEFMTQHRMIYIFQGGCFKYYLKMNLQFTLLAQTKYTSRNMAFFILNVVEKKISKRNLSSIIMNRLRTKNANPNIQKQSFKPSDINYESQLSLQKLQSKDVQQKQKNSKIHSELFIKQAQTTPINLTISDMNLQIQQPERIIKYRSQQSSWVQSMLNEQPLLRSIRTGSDLDQFTIKGNDQNQQQLNSQSLYMIKNPQFNQTTQTLPQPPPPPPQKKRNFWKDIAKKLNKTKKSIKPSKNDQARSYDRVDNDENNSNSDNQFDEDLTEKSSFIQEVGGGVFQVQGKEKFRQIDDGGNSVTSSQRPDQIQVGSQIVKSIFSSQQLTNGEKKFILFNACLSLLFIGFYFGLIVLILDYMQKYNAFLSNLNLLNSIQMRYEEIIGQYAIGLISHNLQDEQNGIYWLNSSIHNLNENCNELMFLTKQNENYIINLQTGQSDQKVEVQLMNAVTLQLYVERMYLISFFEMIVSALQQLNSTVLGQSSFFLIQFNYNNVLNIIDLNNNDVYDVFQQQQLKFRSTFLSLYIVLIVILVVILFTSLWANKQYNQYLRFLLLSITRIKVEEIDVEVKRLQQFLRVMSDALTPWISQDLYQIYFDTNIVDNKSKDDMRGQRERMNQLNQMQDSKFRERYQMFQYFLVVNTILIGFSIVGFTMMSNFYWIQLKQFNNNQQIYQLKSELSTFVTKSNLFMIQHNNYMQGLSQFTNQQIQALDQQVEESRNSVMQSQNSILQSSDTNDVFYQLLTDNICESYTFLNTNKFPHKFIDLCAQPFGQSQFIRGLNNIITGIVNIRDLGDQQLIDNNQYQFFIWDYYRATNHYFEYSVDEVQQQIQSQTNSNYIQLLIFNIFGLILTIIVAQIAFFFVNYFRRSRKGSQLLLSLIPHEKLSLDLTVNLLKQLEHL